MFAVSNSLRFACILRSRRVFLIGLPSLPVLEYFHVLSIGLPSVDVVFAASLLAEHRDVERV